MKLKNFEEFVNENMYTNVEFLELNEIIDVIKKHTRRNNQSSKIEEIIEWAKRRNTTANNLYSAVKEYLSNDEKMKIDRKIDELESEKMRDKILIRYYEGSYKFDDDLFQGRDLERAQEFAKTRLERQLDSRPTDKTLWAAFYPSGGDEIFDARIKINN